jgi:hypothetical protein
MRARSDSTTRDALEASLEEDFTAETVWPISYASMAALIDMGLSDAKIARYFRVSPAAVADLRTEYGFRTNMT